MSALHDVCSDSRISLTSVGQADEIFVVSSCHTSHVKLLQSGVMSVLRSSVSDHLLGLARDLGAEEQPYMKSTLIIRRLQISVL